MFTGDNPLLGAATSVAGPLTMLLSNDLEPITLEGLDFSIDTAETPRSATIERVWLDEVRPRAGRTLPLKILTRSYRGEEKISTVPIDIPANASGSLSILVTDGNQLNALEQRELRRSLQPQTVAQMIRLLNDTRRNNRIYVRLLTGTPGAVVNGEAMTGAAAVGAGRARERSQRRQLHADPQRHRRRVGTADAVGGHRLAPADDRGRRRTGPLRRGNYPIHMQKMTARAVVCAVLPPRPGQDCPPRPRRSGRSRRRPISSKATSKTCRSTATAGCFLGPSAALIAETAAPFLWTRCRRQRRHACGPAAATKARSCTSRRTAR